MSVTTKQRVFIDEYLKCFNAAEAARRAGYSEKTARMIGRENLTKLYIKAEIDRRLAESAMAADEVLARVGDIGRGDLTQYLTVGGELDIERLKEDGKGHLIKKYRRTRRTVHRKDGGIIETELLEAELYPADAAHDKLMRYHGLYNDKVVHTWKEEVLELLRLGKVTETEVKQELGDELASELFDAAGIRATSD